MKKIVLACAAVLSAAALPVIGAAQSHSGHRASVKAPPTAKKAALICPVTGDKIASVKKAAAHSTYKGKTYYFCCSGCKPRFDKSPAKFVKNSAKGQFEKM